MRKFFRVTALATLALGVTALSASAQEKATELTGGLLGFQSTSCTDCSTVTVFATGGAYAAIAFYLSPGMALEPTVTVSTVSIGDGGGSTTSLGFGLALPYYFNKGWGRKGPYLAPRVVYSSFSCTGCESQDQFGLGVALGTKLPLNDMAAVRLQASYDYGFESSPTPSTSTFGASLGLSVFLK